MHAHVTINNIISQKVNLGETATRRLCEIYVSAREEAKEGWNMYLRLVSVVFFLPQKKKW